MSFIRTHRGFHLLVLVMTLVVIFSLNSIATAYGETVDTHQATLSPSQEGGRTSQPEVAASPGAEPASSAATGMLIIQPMQGYTVNIRAQPDLDSPIVGGINEWGIAQVIEPYDGAVEKLEQGEWVRVRASNGVEGYTASYLYTVQEDIPPAGPLQEQAADLTDEMLLVSPLDNRIRVREAPEDGDIIGFVEWGNVALVIEPMDTALEKLGQVDRWLHVRLEDGTEGYTAAWFFQAYTGESPDWVVAYAESLQPDDSTLVAASTGIAPVDPEASSAEVDAEPSGVDIFGLSSTNGPAESIPPLGASVIDLDLNEATDEEIAQSDPAVVELAPATDSSTDVIPNGITSEEVPITIALVDDIDIESAQLTINDTVLANFNDQPYEYMLNTSMLSEGPYELGFEVTTAEGVTSSSILHFDVVDVPGETRDVELATADPEHTADLGLEEVQEEALQEQPISRVLLVRGERIPFQLTFDLRTGLQPTEMEVEAEPATSTSNLGDIMSRIPSNIIPEPIYEQLAAQHPQFATIVILMVIALLVPQGVFTLYWMLYTWNNPERAEQYRSPKEYYEPEYSFTAILPARHEAGVIADTIKAIDRIDYPDHLKEILIMIRDEDDDETIAKANETIWELGKENIRLITFADGPKNKPNGLNKGLAAASKDVVCIFDAEDEPHPDIYNIVNTVMLRDNADVVQSGVQLMNFESSWFAPFNVLEYFFWFKSGLHCFTREMGVTPLGGNTVFFKRDWLEHIDGWDASCLTEDADVGIRLTKLGAKIQIVYDAQHATQEETPDTVESFIKQRTRWVQGFYQIFFGGQWMGLRSLKQKLTAIYILLNSVLQAGIVLYLPLGIYIAATQQVPVTVAILSYLPILLLFLQLLTNLVGIREFANEYNKNLPLFFTLKMILYYYPYQLLLSIAAIRAVFRFARQEHAWEKTAHSNLHRQTASQTGV